MKPAPFEYVRPDSVAQACEMLAADEDARIIAGGQTLVPMLAMRLARAAKLIDIYRLPELNGIRVESDVLVIGATTRQVQVERSALAAQSTPLLAKALPWVGHPPTRNRGTVGGSVANADPSAEIPLVAVTLGAEIEITNPDGVTSMPADDFFIGPMLTSVMPGDCVTAVRFPIWRHARVGTAFHEVSARKSDFAFVAAAAQVALDDDGKCIAAALGIGGVGDRAVRLDLAKLLGETAGTAKLKDVVAEAATVLEPSSDLHVSATYRTRVAVTLGVRALEDAMTDARSSATQSNRGITQ
ncbi:FAD binding domain-containing protein [Bradyrhizobium sp. WSM 1704]|uniref:FAD binding domain-containing protein n=1 Tax=Bradyrhizobium semiaridum TaxID=2821404 RepID=UPI001CE33611|nr:FAD binding domain-containing protein [Bradyrhizobium semiaridum]MCA6121331.1 FAD binding domain-containing protein [Bradyrhizobium semiaridum]